MDSFKTKSGNIIAMPEAPMCIRINKKVGLFAKSSLEADEREQVDKLIETHGLGKWVEGFIVEIAVGLRGRFYASAPEDDYVFISLLLTDADEDKKLRPGLLVHFFCSKFEAEFFLNAKTEAEIQELYGDEMEPQVLRLEFDKNIRTKYASTIKPPTPTFREATPDELEYFEAVQTIHEKFPHKIPDPAVVKPAVYDDKGELTEGVYSVLEAAPVAAPALTAG